LCQYVSGHATTGTGAYYTDIVILGIFFDLKIRHEKNVVAQCKALGLYLEGISCKWAEPRRGSIWIEKVFQSSQPPRG
jgi:hypothetical protein